MTQELRVQDITFGYSREPAVLQELSPTFSSGKTVLLGRAALVLAISAIRLLHEPIALSEALNKMSEVRLRANDID